MDAPHISRRLIARAYRIVRILVRLIFIGVLAGVVLFAYLRIQGIPDPLLRKVVRRANEAGIPVSVEGITLTLGGWRADRVRYYSNFPDDLEPIFQAKSVFFSVRQNDAAEEMNVDVKAEGVTMEPSAAWGIAIPAGSPVRRIGRVEVVLGFKPDCIVLSNGRLDWLGSRFNVFGTILKRRGVPLPERQPTLLPVKVSAAQFQTLEDRLARLSLPTGATIDIDFEIDPMDYAKSWLDFVVKAKKPAFRNVGFSRAEIAGHYAYPALQLERAALFDGKQSAQVSGEYNFETGKIQGTIFNSISSTHPMQLFPASIAWLEKAELRIDHLPRLEIGFGPAAPKDLPNHFSGAFSIRDVSYKGLEIESLRGKLKQINRRTELTQMHAIVRGQETRAEKGGSTLRGGSVEGEFFWDQDRREFGVKADANFDPNLLLEPLAPVGIATDIIQYFSFHDQPPRGHVELGAMVDDWRTFYLDIQAVAAEAAFRGVGFSSINATAGYRQGRLKLDPIAGIHNGASTQGSVEVDFLKEIVSFDVESGLAPAQLEKMIIPHLNLFGEKIKAQGNVSIAARGCVDWGSMNHTDFSATVATDRIELPVGAADTFRAEIIGEGSLLSVRNANFLLHGGASTCDFTIRLDPAKKTMPYEFDASFLKVDFKKLIEAFSSKSLKVSGRLSGTAHIKADLSTNFFPLASGSASIRVNKGQLTDLPLFKGFTKVVRSVIPGFDTFSITDMDGDFTIANGKIASKKVSFDGDIISATAHGCYHFDSGFDAQVQIRTLRKSGLVKLVRIVTDPLMKLFDMTLTGTLSDPEWRLEMFSKKPFSKK